MWSKLVDILLDRYRALPRKELVASMVKLRDAMRLCHEKWHTFKAVVVARGHNRAEPLSNSLVDAARKDWQAAAFSLTRILRQVATVLSIYAPEASRLVRFYLITESMIPTEEDMARIVEYSMRETDSTGASDYDAAMSALDAFIAKTFKPEEIHDAARSRLQSYIR